MTTFRRIIVAVLLPLAIGGALVLSASATVNLFISQGVPTTIAPFAVLMLEVASLAGTLLWVLVERRSLRRDAVLVTVAATGVALVAGLHAYGPVGAVAGILLVATVHLASRAWREEWAEQPAAPPTVADLVATRTTSPQAASVAVLTPATDATTPRGPRLPVILHGGEPVDETTVAAARDFLADKPAAGRGALMRQLDVTDTLARKLLDELRPLAVAS